ncbi:MULTISPECIES: DUF3325 domain-containing protein [Hyphomonas]|uniref:DUF3325 domain-containing protein n=1 Tax=Hyphomonas adhaerens TaxID=81029 RepID=A0A3B9GWB6_9PROT|nr:MULTISPECIES: DUF3325 domain-containing protein [Hyphomonas]MBB40792.1 hypothetical protein [Hyphomonas sp.]HAE26702.1 DUF3325 domain-containing protein [Hyphomonas adhaerens]|tara:strand:+ start:722 stop:1066 length:345 start_codon:yes stop_codon:yes gene_type:complete
MYLLALCLAFCGMALICVSMTKHYAQVFGKAQAVFLDRTLLRYAGCSVLAVSLLPFLVADGISVAITTWFGALSLAAVILVLMLTYRPAWLKFGILGSVVLLALLAAWLVLLRS